jgi:hypothetical protein
MLLHILLSTFVLHAAEQGAFLTEIKTCKPAHSPKQVLVIKQWHLSPATNTFINSTQKVPQSENQEAIYSQLVQWIDSKKVDVVVAEGCEGVIDANFALEFNGWNYKSLHKVAATPEYPQIATHIPLKLEAKYGPVVATICGDDEALVKEGTLHLSNIRGLTGFYSRIKDKKGQPEDLVSYMEGAAQVLKIPPTNDSKAILSQLRSRSEKEIAQFEITIEKRNTKIVQTIEQTDGKNFAVVIGGLHGDNLAIQLEAKGFNCKVYEPKGYSPQAETLIADLKKAIH